MKSTTLYIVRNSLIESHTILNYTVNENNEILVEVEKYLLPEEGGNHLGSKGKVTFNLSQHTNKFLNEKEAINYFIASNQQKNIKDVFISPLISENTFTLKDLQKVIEGLDEEYKNIPVLLSKPSLDSSYDGGVYYDYNDDISIFLAIINGKLSVVIN